LIVFHVKHLFLTRPLTCLIWFQLLGLNVEVVYFQWLCVLEADFFLW